MHGPEGMNAEEEKAHIPLHLLLGIPRERDDLDVIAIPVREVVFREQLRLHRSAGGDFVDNVRAYISNSDYVVVTYRAA
jgi:hypothetical protein